MYLYRLLQLRVCKPASSFSTKLLSAANCEGPRKFKENWKPIESDGRVTEYLSRTYRYQNITFKSNQISTR